MRDDILNFNKQFEFEPQIENPIDFSRFKKFIICGMGGSNLAPGLLKIFNSNLEIVEHRDYGLPMPEALGSDTLIVASSYSGETEEPLDSLDLATKNNLPIIAVSVGGKLLDKAEELKLPFIKFPDLKIQPRLAVGLSFMALAKITREEKVLAEAKSFAAGFKPENYEEVGRALAEKIKGFIPAIYASRANFALAYSVKVNFNETAKAPAFANFLPELNHNEISWFRASGGASGLPKQFYFVLLEDSSDHPRVIKRLEIMKKMFLEKDLPYVSLKIDNSTVLDKIFGAVITGNWAAYYLSQVYGVEPMEVPIIEEFKKMMKQ